MQQIAMAAVQLDHIVTDVLNTSGGGSEFSDAALDVVFGHRVRHRPARVVGNGGRRFGSPTAFGLAQDRLAACCGWGGRSFASSMRKLDAELGDAVSPAKVMDPLERRLVRVRPQTCAFRRNAAA